MNRRVALWVLMLPVALLLGWSDPSEDWVAIKSAHVSSNWVVTGRVQPQGEVTVIVSHDRYVSSKRIAVMLSWTLRVKAEDLSASTL